MNYFEKGWTDDLCCWMYTESRLLREIEVYISGTYPNPDAVTGLAVLDPHEYNNLASSALDTIMPIPGEIEKGNFVRLEELVDYNYDSYRGFFWVNLTPADNEVLAISYLTDIDTIGTFSSEFTDTTKVPVFRLIKSRRMNPTHEEIWPLMMKNVYFLGDSMINRECFNVQIEYNLNGEHQTIQPVDPKKSYIYLMGLDRKDTNGFLMENGDGIVDSNWLIVNPADGILMFPGLYPFNPLPQSRFQIAEKADLYNTTIYTNLLCNYRYDIVVTSKTED